MPKVTHALQALERTVTVHVADLFVVSKRRFIDDVILLHEARKKICCCPETFQKRSWKARGESMTTFLFNRRNIFSLAAILGVTFCCSVIAQNDEDWRAKRVVDSFCFPKHYGGYMLRDTLSDGRLRLTAEARSVGSGRSWGLELLVTPDEMKEIWLTSLKTVLEPKEIDRVEVYCNPDNTVLRSAVNKENYLRTKPTMDRVLKEQAPGFPAFPFAPGMQLTQDEQKAIAEFRSNEEVMVIYKKISEKVGGLIWNRYLALGARVRHIPYQSEDHQFSPLRKPITLIEKKGNEK